MSQGLDLLGGFASKMLVSKQLKQSGHGLLSTFIHLFVEA